MADGCRICRHCEDAPAPRRGVCFWTFPTQMRNDAPHRSRHAWVMNDFADDGDDLFLDAVETIVLHVLHRLGGDPEARFRCFRRLLDVARDVAEEMISPECRDASQVEVC